MASIDVNVLINIVLINTSLTLNFTPKLTQEVGLSMTQGLK